MKILQRRTNRVPDETQGKVTVSASGDERQAESHVISKDRQKGGEAAIGAEQVNSRLSGARCVLRRGVGKLGDRDERMNESKGTLGDSSKDPRGQEKPARI